MVDFNDMESEVNVMLASTKVCVEKVSPLWSVACGAPRSMLCGTLLSKGRRLDVHIELVSKRLSIHTI